MKTGQLTIPLALALSAVTGVITGLTFYFSGQLAQNDRSARIEQNVAVLQTQKDNIEGHLSNVDVKLDRINEKIDSLLINRGIDPNKLSTLSKN